MQAQTNPQKIAIVDFDISSNSKKYEGLGKAMADMLITDMKNSVSNKQAVFIERNQINKILKEQNFQKGTNVDKTSTVAFGKVLGVNYILTGSIFVLDGICTIDSKLLDVTTGEIIYAESVDGILSGWLQLKNKLGGKLSQKLSLPFPKYKLEETAEISENILTTYSSAVEACDNNNFDEAQKLLQEIKSEDANFEYSSPLMKHIIELINATKKFDNKEEAILEEAQMFVDSLILVFNTKFPEPVADAVKIQEMGQWNFDIWKVIDERKHAFESQIDPHSKFSAEFQSKFSLMLQSLFNLSNTRAIESSNLLMGNFNH
jgi:TolB-like protein